MAFLGVVLDVLAPYFKGFITDDKNLCKRVLCVIFRTNLFQLPSSVMRKLYHRRYSLSEANILLSSYSSTVGSAIASFGPNYTPLSFTDVWRNCDET